MERDQRLYKPSPASGLANRDVITAVLALGPDERRDPDHSRVEEKECIRQILNEVKQIVPPADMRQLMKQDRLYLVGGNMGKHADGHQDHRFQKTYYHGNLDDGGFQQQDRTADL